MSIRRTPPEQTELALSPTTARVIHLGAEIQSGPPDEIEFLHTVLCQVGLPRKRTVERRFERNNGKASLLITAGEMYNKGTWEELFVPYGTRPRLALFHISTEALRKNSRTIAIGRTISEFMRRLNISQNGPSREAFRAQMNALCACEMKLGYGTRNLNTRPVDEFDAWTADLAKDSTIELSEKFWLELKENAVPLDPRALEGLQHSALALDIYTWLAHRLHRVRINGERLTWANLRMQFGQEYTDDKNFKKAFLIALRQVSVVYPEARLEQVRTGLKLISSPPPIARPTLIAFQKTATPTP